MRHVKLFAVASLFAVSAAFTSCNKEEPAKDSATPAPIVSSASVAQMSSQNPLNFVGVQHNAFLDSMSTISGFHTFSPQQIHQVLTAFNASRGESTLPFTDVEDVFPEALNIGAGSFDLSDKLLANGLPADAVGDMQTLLNTIGFR